MLLSFGVLEAYRVDSFTFNVYEYYIVSYYCSSINVYAFAPLAAICMSLAGVLAALEQSLQTTTEPAAAFFIVHQ
jgi:hypothetical protein